VLFWVVVASFVRFYEEPTLSAKYGEEYDAYRRAVRGWLPRATPWTAESVRSRRSSSMPG
jgi:protein-S-isoprenylcysteine O-methyltransferase Ste14